MSIILNGHFKMGKEKASYVLGTFCLEVSLVRFLFPVNLSCYTFTDTRSNTRLRDKL